MTIKNIYLDMDGVLANFVGAAAKLWGKTEAELLAAWPKGVYSVTEPLGIKTEEELWERIDKAGHEHWSQLPKYPWADILWDYCENVAPTTVLTSPSRSPQSVFGKLVWLQRWKGVTFRSYSFTPRKFHLAKPGSVLIDDYEYHCKKFREHGGEAIPFPRVWNENHEHAKLPVDYVQRELEKMQ